MSEKQRTTENFNNSDQDSARNSVRYSARKNIPLHLFLIENIFSIYLGNPFTELTSENKKFTLLMEQNDVVLIGHLVLYHILDAQDHHQNIQLWHSDYSTNGSKAIIDVRFIYKVCTKKK